MSLGQRGKKLSGYGDGTTKRMNNQMGLSFISCPVITITHDTMELAVLKNPETSPGPSVSEI